MMSASLESQLILTELKIRPTDSISFRDSIPSLGRSPFKNVPHQRIIQLAFQFCHHHNRGDAVSIHQGARLAHEAINAMRMFDASLVAESQISREIGSYGIRVENDGARKSHDEYLVTSILRRIFLRPLARISVSTVA